NIYKCLCCGKRCSRKNGISKHVLQHSQKCHDYHIKEFGKDKRYWPEKSGMKHNSCKNCGEKLKDPRSKNYCPSCTMVKYNPMKNAVIREK
ncbi:MAG: hypothetical protein KAS32_16660, partial [Candidatus Peribacteraceae bacterium]|nr:hypothetical protein [Candidatus Peribacteraceae bacterium]